MLWFVGTGINGYRGLSLAAVDILKKCSVVYVERFTSALSDSDLQGLNSILGRQAEPVQRWFVEDGREILEVAKTKEVALVTYGDPLIATTHTELRSRAARNLIKTGVLHAASGIASIMGETGLHAYKFGRMVTMMSEPQSVVSVYNTIFENLLAGSHTLILTEYSSQGKGKEEPFFLSPTSVFKMLLDTERDQKYQIFSDNTFAVVASRVGAGDQRITSGKVGSLAKIDFGAGPHSIIVTGSLHFTEVEALAALTENMDEPSDNSQNIRRISVQMVERYAPKAKQAIQQMRDIVRQDAGNNSGVFEVLDNAEYYIADAERFLRQAKFELAVLSIGYAEGLVDALRFQKGINPWETHG
ncbi:MAG: diphthine synthase [Nitrososphaera sp.]|uniref:Putative diphthine synthase n=1 Tax=Nitrososphaera gargensis (strain Ga9.2) TaxID=1237085 RepID=K0IF33_NITGG|nr:diphthine synthase [Candidatus Nitrososphaera gargensis]AFU58390.1 putative diphthine synthase [Candidatus Nitrososphaera gargensis Ga9.2]